MVKRSPEARVVHTDRAGNKQARMFRVLLVLLATTSTAACAPHVVRPTNAPAPALQMKLAGLPKVWVAGFATEKNPEFDLNTETVRLLRAELRTWSSAPVLEVEPLAIDSEQRFTDVPYWRRLGDEHGRPLIITGSVQMRVAPARVVHRGVRTMYAYATGRVLDSTVVVIDGTTGERLSTQALASRMRYGVGRFSSGLALYFAMMEGAMGDWLETISAASNSARN
jgi:hypothetical protein